MGVRISRLRAMRSNRRPRRQRFDCFARRISMQVRTKVILCPRERAAIFDGLSMEKYASIDPADLEASVAKHPPQRYRPAQIQPSDALEIVFTSGTTAIPIEWVSILPGAQICFHSSRGRVHKM